MAKNSPVYAARGVPASVQAPRIIHYVDPAAQEMQVFTAGELAAKRQKDRQLYARWVVRQAAIAERDRKLRRFWLGFGAVIGLAFLTGLIVLGWLIWTVVGLGVLAVPVVFGLGALVAAGGHRCITIVQHMH